MKRFLIVLLNLSLSWRAYAVELKPEMYLHEHVLSYMSSFDISDEDRKLATVYRRVMGAKNTVYHFDEYKYDPYIGAITNSSAFSLNWHDESTSIWFPSYGIYDPNGVRLATTSLNFWGTIYTLYEDNTDLILATMQRAFLSIFDDGWTIKIVNMKQIQEKSLDARLLLTMLAIQVDIKYQQEILERNRKQEQNNQNKQGADNEHHAPAWVNSSSALAVAATSLSRQKLAELNALTDRLENDFQQQYPSYALPDDRMAQSFIEYCYALIQSPDTPDETKESIRYLLQVRMQQR